MTSNYRNSRWFYVSAVAYSGIGDTVRGMDLMQKAIQMEPDNPVYKQLYREYSNVNQRAAESSGTRNFNSPLIFLVKIFFGLMVARYLFYFIQMLLYGLLYAR